MKSKMFQKYKKNYKKYKKCPKNPKKIQKAKKPKFAKKAKKIQKAFTASSCEQKSDLDGSVEGTYVTNYMVTIVGSEKPCT
jgi:hypothetical protein